MPPLRERKEDIPLLIEQINELEAAEMNRPAPKYTAQAINFLSAYRWPGNVRELKNFVKRLVILKPDQTIVLSDLKKFVESDTNLNVKNKNILTTVAESEYQYIEQALIQCKGVVGGPGGAAHFLSIPKSTLQYRLKKHKLNPADYKGK